MMGGKHKYSISPEEYIFVALNLYLDMKCSFSLFQYLVFDTQHMMGGKHKYSLSPEEYIFVALNLRGMIQNNVDFCHNFNGRG